MASGPSWAQRHGRITRARDAAARAQKEADRLWCIAWNVRMDEGGPAQPSPSLRAAVSGGFGFLRVTCSVCLQQGWIDLAQVRRPPSTPIWQLEGALACDHCRRAGARSPRAVLERLTTGMGAWP